MKWELQEGKKITSPSLKSSERAVHYIESSNFIVRYVHLYTIYTIII